MVIQVTKTTIWTHQLHCVNNNAGQEFESDIIIGYSSLKSVQCVGKSDGASMF